MPSSTVPSATPSMVMFDDVGWEKTQGFKTYLQEMFERLLEIEVH